MKILIKMTVDKDEKNSKKNQASFTTAYVYDIRKLNDYRRRVEQKRK